MTMIIEPEGEADFPDAVEDVRKTGSFLNCRIASLTFNSVLFYTYLFMYTSTKSACIDTTGNPEKTAQPVIPFFPFFFRTRDLAFPPFAHPPTFILSKKKKKRKNRLMAG